MKPWLAHYDPDVPHTLVPYPDRTLIDYLTDLARDHGDKTVPLGGAFWHGGAKDFIYKGVNGRWRDEIDPAMSAKYEARAREELGEECAAWLLDGTR